MHSLKSFLFRWIARELMTTGLAGVCLFLVSGCALFRPTQPVLHKASCDLSPVLALHLPKYINTLAGCPRDETHVENGFNTHVGGRQPDDIKEMFDLKNGNAEYRFILFFSDSAAVRWYESEKTDHPVFQETTADDCSGCVHYTEQPRADPEGGSGLMGYYISRASFRLHNVFIRVTTQDDRPQSDKLTIAVNGLARMLSVALASTNQSVN